MKINSLTEIYTTLHPKSDTRLPLVDLAIPAGLLGLSCGLSLALLAGRAAVARSFGGYAFLVWNLFLAGIPLLLAGGMLLLHRRSEAAALAQASRATRILFWAAAVLWLLFFPNAPYLLTDLLHLRAKPTAPIWFDVLLVASFVWNGLVMGFASLAIVHGLLARRLGPGLAWLAVAAVLALSSFGIYLGRFLRFNSWDLFTDAPRLAGDLLSRATVLTHGLPTRVIAFSAGYFVFLLLAYATVQTLPRLLQLNDKADS